MLPRLLFNSVESPQAGRGWVGVSSTTRLNFFRSVFKRKLIFHLIQRNNGIIWFPPFCRRNCLQRSISLTQHPIVLSRHIGFFCNTPLRETPVVLPSLISSTVAQKANPEAQTVESIHNSFAKDIKICICNHRNPFKILENRFFRNVTKLNVRRQL